MTDKMNETNEKKCVFLNHILFIFFRFWLISVKIRPLAESLKPVVIQTVTPDVDK